MGKYYPQNALQHEDSSVVYFGAKHDIFATPGTYLSDCFSHAFLQSNSNLRNFLWVGAGGAKVSGS